MAGHCQKGQAKTFWYSVSNCAQVEFVLLFLGAFQMAKSDIFILTKIIFFTHRKLIMNFNHIYKILSQQHLE
jgi:hypothetical protein